MCVPYYFLMLKKIQCFLYKYIHTHGDDGDDFLPFFPTCRKSLPPVVHPFLLLLWAFGNLAIHVEN